MDLTGVWIGETIGVYTLSHHWIIIQRGNLLEFYTRWENEDSFFHFRAVFNAEKNSFTTSTPDRQVSEIVNENHFEMIRWCYATKGEELVPYYDVAFQRRDLGFSGLLVAWLLRLVAGNQILMRWIC